MTLTKLSLGGRVCLISTQTSMFTAIITTLLLSVNPLFHIEQQTMNQLMISFLGLIFLFERFQNLDLDYASKSQWTLFSLPLILLILHYGPGRIFAFLFIVFWFLKLFFFDKKFKPRIRNI